MPKVVILTTVLENGNNNMPKGKKTCPACKKEHGARKRQCECGHEFGSEPSPKGAKQGSNTKVKQTKHPLGLKFVPVPGLWVFHLEKGMPPIHAPCDPPAGPLTNQDVYDKCLFDGLGDCVYDYIPPSKIADPKLRKLWKKAHDSMSEAWRYLTDGNEQTGKKSRDTNSA
jgi:hypothetical protein